MIRPIVRVGLSGLVMAAALAMLVLTVAASTAGDPTAPATGFIQWQAGGVPLTADWYNQRRPQIVRDGTGGAIVVWQDYRNQGNLGPADLYAQRVAEDGTPQWPAGGVPVALPGNQRNPQVVSDGGGGAIVTWDDDRTGRRHVYAQRVAADGVRLWANDGVQLSSDTAAQYIPVLVSDGAGGAIAAWVDNRNNQGPWPIVYAQRIRADGALLWTAGGVTMTHALNGQDYVQIVSDGENGAILAWVGGCEGVHDLCVQRVRSDGVPLWGNGVKLSGSARGGHRPWVAADGAGGALVVWVDERNANADIYAQRVYADGTRAWSEDGVPVVVADGDQRLPLAVSDGQGGAIVAWMDARYYTALNVSLQRLGADGTRLWNPAGVPIATQVRYYATTDYERDYDLTVDGAGGVLVGWQEAVYGPPERMDRIWLQRVSADGAAVWPGRGIALREDPQVTGLGAVRLLSAPVGGAIVAWEDNLRQVKTENVYDIYVQRVTEGAYRRYLPLAVR